MSSNSVKSNEAETLYRHMVILRMIPRRGRISTLEILSRLERDYNVSVDIRTVQRNLNSLSRVFPLLADGKRPQGWSWSPDATLYDIPNIDPQTALTFNLVERFIKELVPRATVAALSPYFNNASSILKSASAGAAGRWPEKIRMLARGDILLSPKIDEDVVEKIYEALYRDQRCKIVYCPKSGGRRNWEINPLGLVFVGKVPYLIANRSDDDILRQLPLQRIKSVELLDLPSVVPAGFSIDGYIEHGGFGYPVKPEKIRLVIIMESERASHLQETPLSRGQKHKTLEDGRVRVEAVLQDSLQLRFWLKGFGADLEVIEPIYVRDEMRKGVESLAGRYGAA